MPPKPILKTSLPSAHAASTPLTAPESSARQAPPKQQASHHHLLPEQYRNRPGTDPRHLAIALHHAQQIQAQKDTESLILDRILELVTFPTSPSADPASPSAEDAKAFKSALRPFQPADYDNLILERNIEGLCGYTLCPREHRKEDPKAKFRIMWGAKGSGSGGRGREMNIVPREKLEMWCSNECAERAMYIRVQLAEEPAWERRAGDTRGKEIALLEEARAKEQQGRRTQGRPSATIGEVLGQLDNLHMQGENESRDAMDGVGSTHLALERGDAHPALQGGRVNIQIKEKESVPREKVRSPEPRPEDRTGGSIEGYVPKEIRGKQAEREDEDLDMLDML